MKRLAPARQPDRVVHGSGDCGVEGRAPRHARRPAPLLRRQQLRQWSRTFRGWRLRADLSAHDCRLRTPNPHPPESSGVAVAVMAATGAWAAVAVEVNDGRQWIELPRSGVRA